MTWSFTLSILHAGMYVRSHSTVLLKERRVKMKGRMYQNLILHSPSVCKNAVALPWRWSQQKTGMGI